MRQIIHSMLFALSALILVALPAVAAEEKCQDCTTWQTGRGGRGKGHPECVVSFYAPPGATKFEIQLYDEKGVGILPDKSGKIMPRGGTGVGRVGVGCSFVRRAATLIACAVIGGREKTTRLYANGQYLPTALKKRRLTVPF